MLDHAHASPTAEASPEVKSEAGQQYQSQEMKPCLYSPATSPSSRTYSGTASSSGGDNFPQSDNFIKCSNSHNITRGHDSSKGTLQSESTHHQQSGPDRMLQDQMTAPNTMPVFGGEGYNRSPFAIHEDFVAYLFSGQQIDNPSPMQIGQQGGYAKSVFSSENFIPILISL